MPSIISNIITNIVIPDELSTDAIIYNEGPEKDEVKKNIEDLEEVHKEIALTARE